MNKCARIICGIQGDAETIMERIHKSAVKLVVEGHVAKTEAQEVTVIVCGPIDHVDQLVDAIHQLTAKHGVVDIAIEPFLKDKDYRGVFRVIN